MYILLYTLIVFLSLEILSMLIVKWARKKFPWLITSEDEYPELSKEGLDKFIQSGYDPELGWIRKPNTSNQEKGKYGPTTYHIDSDGSRSNPANADKPIDIACFGDSFTFCRQVNDNETWEYYLSELSNRGVSNYGVGNYGIDQAYLRLEREIKVKKINPKIVLMGVVPSTIVRILCIWKHYNEFGNTFGFKPRFDIVDGKLVLIKNYIDKESKFLNYKNYIPEIREKDFFYKSKFKKEMIRFPYSYHTLKNSKRNFKIISTVFLNTFFKQIGVKSDHLAGNPLEEIMKINLQLRCKLFSDKYALDLLHGIIENFKKLSSEYKFVPVFVLLPQKDDVLRVKKKHNFYSNFIEKTSKSMQIIDLTVPLSQLNNLDDLYSDDGVYGGHFSKDGNKLVANYIYNILKEKQNI